MMNYDMIYRIRKIGRDKALLVEYNYKKRRVKKTMIKVWFWFQSQSKVVRNHQGWKAPTEIDSKYRVDPVRSQKTTKKVVLVKTESVRVSD